MSHKPAGRLPLLSTRPAVTLCYYVCLLSSEFLEKSNSLQCTDAVGLGVRKSIRPVKLSDVVLIWETVWSEVHTVCYTHAHARARTHARMYACTHTHTQPFNGR